MRVDAEVAGVELVVGGIRAQIVVPLVRIGLAHGGGQGAGRPGKVVVALGLVVVQVHARHDVVLAAAPVELVAVVALQLRQVAGAQPALGRAGDDGVWAPVVDGGGGAVGGAKADHAGPQVAFVASVAQLRLQLAPIVKAVGVRQRGVRGLGVELVVVEAVIVARAQRGHDHAVADEPGVVVGRAATRIQVVQAHREFVARADAPAEAGRHADLFLLAAPVAGVVRQRVDAEGRILARLEVEVAGDAFHAARAHRRVHLMLVHQERLLADLVDQAAGGALAEQHRCRALDHFHAVVVERVALVQRAVAHAVAVDVARRTQRKAAQAHVFLARLARQEGYASGGAQHFAKVVQIAVLQLLFGEHGDRLRDVAQFLVALADLGAGGAQLGLAVGGRARLGGVAHRDRGQGASSVGARGCRSGGRLCQRGAAQGARQQHRTQRQQRVGALGVGCYRFRSALRRCDEGLSPIFRVATGSGHSPVGLNVGEIVLAACAPGHTKATLVGGLGFMRGLGRMWEVVNSK